MRTLVDLPPGDLRRLTELASERRTSRSALVREAVGDYLVRHARTDTAAGFGLWRGQGGAIADDRAEDGLAYQERLRREW